MDLTSGAGLQISELGKFPQESARPSSSLCRGRRRGQGDFALSVKDLRKRYGATEAVAGLSFDVYEGEIFGLLGPNGAGKTTTISILATQRFPSSGDAILFGHSICREPRVVRQMIGVASQDVALYPMLTAAENLRFFGRLYGVAGVELERRIDELLYLVGLEAVRDDYAGTLSGGMKRRLDLAAALVHRPRLVLLDEPASSLDKHARERFFELVRLLRDAGNAIIYTTHYMEEAQGLCDRIGILSRGKLAAIGTLEELLTDLEFPEVIEVRGLPPATDLTLLQAAGNMRWIENSDGMVRLFVNNAAVFLGPLQKIISRAQKPVRLKITPVSLGDLYLRLTDDAE